MKNLIEKNISMTFLAFCLLGLFLPYLDQIPAWVVMLILAVVIFFACFKIEMQEMREIHLSASLLFYLIRFIIFPAILFYSMMLFSAPQALALFLLALLPPATSSPAMSGLFDGNMSLSFVLLILGSVLTPFVLPLMVAIIIGQSITINIKGMLITLILSILLPIFCFLLIRKTSSVSKWVKQHGSLLSVLLIGVTFAIAISKRKLLILQSPVLLLTPLVISTVGFFLFYLLGWMLAMRAPKKDKVAYALSSGANNISIGISLALLYFPPEVCLFLIVGVIPWIMSFLPFKHWINKPSRLYN